MSKEAVSPLYNLEFNFVYKLLMDLGLQVYFIENENEKDYKELFDVLKDKVDIFKCRLYKLL